VTGLSKILGKSLDVDGVKSRIAHHFSEQFSTEIIEPSDEQHLLSRLGEAN
jgi:hypothetical protein